MSRFTHQAIINLYPQTVSSSVVDGEIAAFDANGIIIDIDPNTIEQEQNRLQAEFNNLSYQRLRSPEYPPIGDQLDDLFRAGAFSEEMAAKIQAVKDKYPKA